MSQVVGICRFLILAATILGGLHGIIVTLPLFFREDSQGVVVCVLLVC